MSVYKIVKAQGSTLGGMTRFVIIDCDHESVSDLIAALREGLVVADLLWTVRTADPHTYFVKIRQPVAIGMADVQRVEVPRASYVEGEPA